MINQLCSRPFCNRMSYSMCACLLPQALCASHINNHTHFSDIEFTFEEISENQLDGIDFSELQYKAFDSDQNRTIEVILNQIYKQLAELQIIKIKLLGANNCPRYFAKLLKDELSTIEGYNEVLSELKTAAECSASIEDFPLSLMETMTITENAEKEVKFLEKLNEALLLEKEVKGHWLSKISESPEKINELKYKFTRKMNQTKKWCIKHNNFNDTKIASLMNGLGLISQIIENDFEVKYFFRVYNERLLIYGAGAWKKEIFNDISEVFLCYKSYPIELPNFKLFCLIENICACIIDLKRMKLDKTFSAPRRGSPFSFVYYDNCVYAFSSISSTCSSNYLEKYDLIKNKKKNLTRLNLITSFGFSCVIFRNSILFCAKNSNGLYKYDFITESYSDIKIHEMGLFSNKFLFTKNIKTYIIDTGNCIFESEIGNDYAWNKVGAYQKYYYPEGINASPENSVYYSIIENESMNIYKFDLCSKKIYEIDCV